MLETKSYSATMQTCKSLFLGTLIPATREESRLLECQKTIVQRKIALFHNTCEDSEASHSCDGKGSTIDIVLQPENRPDFNVLDFVFFHPLNFFKIAQSSETSIALWAKTSKNFKGQAVWHRIKVVCRYRDVVRKYWSAMDKMSTAFNTATATTLERNSAGK